MSIGFTGGEDAVHAASKEESAEGPDGQCEFVFFGLYEMATCDVSSIGGLERCPAIPFIKPGQPALVHVGSCWHLIHLESS